MTTRILIFMLSCSCACAQEIPSISFKIKEDTLACLKPCNKTTASFVFTNDSNNDVLVYGLKPAGPFPAFNNLSGLCDVTRTGTGVQFVLYRSDGTQQLAEFEIVDRDIRKNRVTKKKLDSVFRILNASFLESGMLLKKREEIVLVTDVPLEKFNLKKGLHFLQFTYYCGNKTAELLDSLGVKLSAPLFQGCATTVKIPFVVNHERKAKSYLDDKE